MLSIASLLQNICGSSLAGSWSVNNPTILRFQSFRCWIGLCWDFNCNSEPQILDKLIRSILRYCHLIHIQMWTHRNNELCQEISTTIRRLRSSQSPIVSICQDLSSPAAAAASAASAVASSVSASSCRHTFWQSSKQTNQGQTYPNVPCSLRCCASARSTRLIFACNERW